MVSTAEAITTVQASIMAAVATILIASSRLFLKLCPSEG
jgi:hypothetical protein